MAKENQTMAETAQRDLVITRIFDARRDLVWKAWSEPEYHKRWWGPKDYTCPVSKIDFRVGGKYLNCMRSKVGKEFWCTGTYREIVPLEKIVYTDSFADEKGNVVPATYYGMEGYPIELQVTVKLEVRDGKTKMTLIHEGIPEGEMMELCNTGWNESFDKLAESLKK